MSELELLERVELMLALAESETKLSSILNTFLCPLILKLDSPVAIVKQKVLQICSHINSRLSNSVHLPLKSLAETVTSNHGNAVKSFALVYLHKGITQASAEEALELFMVLMRCFASLATPLQSSLFVILVKLLSQTPTQHDATSGFSNLSPEGMQLFLEKLADFILYRPPPKPDTPGSQPPDHAHSVPHGLSYMAAKFVTSGFKEWSQDINVLASLKLHALQFTLIREVQALGHDNYRFVVYLVSLTVSDAAIQNLASDAIRRSCVPNIEDPALATKLYQLILGIQSANVQESRLPMPMQSKLKVIEWLKKSHVSTRMSEMNLKTLELCIFSYSATEKLQIGTLEYFRWTLTVANQADIEQHATEYYKLLQYILKSKPLINTDTIGSITYDCLGQLCSRVPSLLQNDRIILHILSKLNAGSKSIKASVQRALLTVIPALKTLGSDSQVFQKLLNTLLDYVLNTDPACRLIAVKYASSMFSYDNVSARFICLVGACDVKMDIRDAALQGLDFPTDSGMDSSSSALNVNALLDYLEYRLLQERRSWSNFAHVEQFNGIPVSVYSIVIQFIYHVIVCAPLTEKKLFSNSLDEFARLNGVARREVVAALKGNTEFASQVSRCVKWLESPVLRNCEKRLKSLSLAFLLEIVTLVSPSLLFSNPVSLAEMKDMLFHIDADIRENAGHVFGILLSAGVGQDTEFLKTVQTLLETLKGSQKAEERQGCILTLGFIFSRFIYRLPGSVQEICGHQLEEFVALLLECRAEEQTAAFKAFAELGRYAPLPVSGTPSSKIVQCMIDWLKVAKDVKTLETGYFALCHFCVGNQDLASKALDFFKTLSAEYSKQPDVLLSIGQSLCALLFGFKAEQMNMYLDLGNVDVQLPVANDSVLTSFLDYLIGMASPDSSSANRKTTAVWLLCLLKACDKSEVVRSKLQAIHSSFISLLADRDEFTQEIASKAIGVVYETGDAQLKKAMVDELMHSFKEGRKEAGRVTAGTELFSGSIGNAPDGSAITTYQTVLSLAADMNQPDMVYKFLSLSSHNAVWNSKRGAGMGFSAIAKSAEADLRPYIAKMAPSLYRYQFDPNPRTAETMKGIWRTLIPEPEKLLNEQFDAILKDIIAGLGDKLWRTREACATALSNLLYGRELDKFEGQLEHLWKMCFRILDDIKESVRKAAMTACKTLTSVTLRYCDPTAHSPAKGQKYVDIILPFLLHTGLLSNSDEVKGHSIKTILKLCKQAGVLLRPHIPDLVCTLLEALSSLEPQVLNYLTFHTAKYNISADALDSSRLQAARASPLLEAAESTIIQMDDNVMTKLAPRLCTFMASAIGLPTKAGTARFISTLATKCPNEFRPHADKFAKAIRSALRDRSPVVRKAYAVAAGQIVKYWSEQTTRDFFVRLKTIYFDIENEELISLPAVVLLEMTKASADTLKDSQELVLPLVFVGLHDINREIADIWQQVWEGNVAGSSYAAKLWTREILACCDEALEKTASWQLKRQISKTVADLVKSHGGVFQGYDQCFKMVCDSLEGRTWEGKEDVLESFETVCTVGKTSIIASESLSDKVRSVFVREANKKNANYRRQAILHLGTVMNELEVDVLEQVQPLLWELAEAPSVDMDVDDDDRSKPLALATAANAFKAIGLCFPVTGTAVQRWFSMTTEFMAKHLQRNPWNIRCAILESIKLVCEKAQKASTSASLDGANLIVDGMLDCLGDRKFSMVREKSATAFIALAPLLQSKQLLQSIQTELKTALGREDAGEVRFSLEKALKSLESFKT